MNEEPMSGDELAAALRDELQALAPNHAWSARLRPIALDHMLLSGAVEVRVRLADGRQSEIMSYDLALVQVTRIPALADGIVKRIQAEYGLDAN